MPESSLVGAIGSPFASPAGRAVLSAICCGFGLWLLMSGTDKRLRWSGSLFGIVGLFFLWERMGRLGDPTQSVAFWTLSALAIGSAIATIMARSPVYSAIWFAASLLGTGGLFLLQGAQFLGIATVAVYAGAIVVTFLFVLMLAQPEGQTFYDRVSWGTWPRILATLTAVGFASLLGFQIGGLSSTNVATFRSEIEDVLNRSDGFSANAKISRIEVRQADASSASVEVTYTAVSSGRAEVERANSERAVEQVSEVIRRNHPELTSLSIDLLQGQDEVEVQASDHVASLGAQLFGRHVIAVELAGCLLMAALVGALAIASHGDTAKMMGAKMTGATRQ